MIYTTKNKTLVTKRVISSSFSCLDRSEHCYSVGDTLSKNDIVIILVKWSVWLNATEQRFSCSKVFLPDHIEHIGS